MEITNLMADAADHAAALVHKLEGVHEWDLSEHRDYIEEYWRVGGHECEVCAICGLFRCEL